MNCQLLVVSADVINSSIWDSHPHLGEYLSLVSRSEPTDVYHVGFGMFWVEHHHGQCGNIYIAFIHCRDHPVDGGDNDDNELSNDDDDDDDVVKDTEAFETDEYASTPPTSPHHIILFSNTKSRTVRMSI
ncbi:hypothetical protein Tco_1360645 [Tanacetum coccineum]